MPFNLTYMLEWKVLAVVCSIDMPLYWEEVQLATCVIIPQHGFENKPLDLNLWLLAR